MRNLDPAISLEEFGLSRYEVRAYMTLLGKGPLSAGELAYYANLPRTKVYSTLTKLAKKGLAVIIQGKPLVCTAVSPDEAFGELLSAQESKIRSMRSTMTKLQKISEEGSKPRGAAEHRYLTLTADSVLTTINELILDAKEEISCLIDGWGLRIISQCKNAMLKSVSNKISIKILVSKDCMDSELLSLIPNGASLRFSENGANLFVFDKYTVVIVNGNNGKGALFRSADILSSMYGRSFDIAWANSVDASLLMPLGKELASTTMKLTSVISRDVCSYLSDSIINAGTKEQDILQILESNGLKMGKIGLYDMIKVINACLDITCSASLEYVTDSNIIMIGTRENGKQMMPWALLLANYLARNHISASILPGTNNGKDFVHIKLAKKLTLQ
jgi:sugar-specific transcriptional regulator TrmB